VAYFSSAPDAAVAAALGEPGAAERLCAAVAALVERSDLPALDVPSEDP
jgi:hypothetical protein